jgi:ribosomal protein S18 acetylase RimI-like enzyme
MVTVRDARPEDAPVIAEFNAALALETEGKLLDRALLEPGVRALLADPVKGRYYLAERAGMVVGQTMTTYEWSDWRNGWFWWIQSVYVHGAHRRAGVFRALHTHILERARADRSVCGVRLYVEDDNQRAKRTYQALGFVRGGYEVLQQDFRAPLKG